MNPPYTLEPIGFIRSELTRLDEAPRQGDEGGLEAWLEFTPQAAPLEAIDGTPIIDLKVVLGLTDR